MLATGRLVSKDVQGNVVVSSEILQQYLLNGLSKIMKTLYRYSQSLGQAGLPTQPCHLIEFDLCHEEWLFIQTSKSIRGLIITTYT
jgi:hypothetical protein